MLALTRKVGERIVIGDNIVVTVVSVKGDSVRLTIEAPNEVKIYRGEIYDAIVAENEKAAVVPAEAFDLAMLNDLKLNK
ncbi:carbon storage regulator CsrA [Desulfitobacterium sp. THU1]|uniref:carbon storage regulator CsrA n=1 Tax=Desulfitobacterium sp. THU1 TaxID=3138072 RepID=UPI00311E2431